MQRDTAREGGFINQHFGVVNRRAGGGVAVGRGNAEDSHGAGELLEDEGKVLPAHDRRGDVVIGASPEQVGGAGAHEPDRARVVHRRGIALHNARLGGAAMRLRDVRQDAGEGSMGVGAARVGQGPQCAVQLDAVGNDIVGRAGVKLGDREDRGVDEGSSPGDVRLERQHRLARRRDRVDRIMGHGRVAALAVDGSEQLVGRSEQRAAAAGDGTAGDVGEDMDGEGRLGRGIVEQPFLDHVAGAGLSLLARLEHEQDGAGEPVAAGAKDPRGAGEHGRMSIMAAGVHMPGGGRGESESGVFVDRQRIHVAAQQHGAAGRCARPGAVEASDEARAGLAVADGQRQAGERRLELVSRAVAFEAEFGIGVDRAAKHDRVGMLGLGSGGPVDVHGYVHPWQGAA